MTTINRPNWVKERAECEVRVVFDKLCEEVKTDVEEMQNYISKFLPPHSSIKIEKQSTFLDVLCESDYANTTFHVQFQLNKADKLIQVAIEDGGPQKQAHTIKPVWNSKKECCELLLDNDPLEPWAISKEVLGPLFFREK